MSSVLLSASLLATGVVGCSDDDDADDGRSPLDAGTDSSKPDAGSTLLDANLDATSSDASVTSPVTEVSSKAADLAVTINLLLGEHLILAAKATGAALRGPTSMDEYAAYGDLLNKNGLELGDLVGSAFGEQAKTQFNSIWSAHNGFFVDYTVGVATNDEAKKTTAVNNLTTVYVPQFSALVSTAAGLPLATVTQLVTEHVTSTKDIVDAQGAKNYTAVYTNIRKAFAHMAMLGNPLAQGVAAKLPAVFPGDAGSKAALFRVALNQYLQEHLFLASFATGAAIQGRMDEFTAAGSALNANGTDIGKAVGGLYGTEVETQFNSIWSAHNGFFVDYTQGVAGSDAAKKMTAVNNLTTVYVPMFSSLLEAATGTAASVWSPGVAEHVTSTAMVVDAQFTLKTTPSAANATAAAGADREAGHHMRMLGDPLAKGIVAKQAAKF